MLRRAGMPRTALLGMGKMASKGDKGDGRRRSVLLCYRVLYLVSFFSLL